MTNWLNTQLIEILRVGLRGSEERQRAIAHNIANLNTPGYKRWDVHFADALRAVLAQNGPPESERARQQPEWSRDTATSGRPDGNNVDLEAELALMADNELYHQGLVRLLNGQFNRLRTVIQRGGE